MPRKLIPGAFLSLTAGLLGALGFALPAGAQTSPSPYTTVSFYLPGGLLAGTISPAPSGQIDFPATRYSYDPVERLSTVETGYLNTWPGAGLPSTWGSLFVVRKMVTYSYDANGRKTAETVTGYVSGTAQGTTNVTQFSYDYLDRLTCTAVRMNLSAALPSSACTQATPRGSYGPDRITQNTYDALSRLTGVQKAVGTSAPVTYATYIYTTDSLPQYITDADGNKMQLAYDGFDRLSDWYFPSKTSPPNVDTSDYEAYGYDNNGNRTSLKKRDGENITYQFDALNRMSAKVMPTASQSVTYGYDLRGLMTSAVFTSSGAGVTNVFDGFGRMTSTTNTTGGVSHAVSQGFDNDGDRTSLTFPDSNNYFDYDLDGLDRLKDVRENGGAVILSEGYDPLLLSGETRGAVASIYGYDSAERPQSWADSFASSGPNVTTSLAYNPANQIFTRTRDNDAYAYAAYVNGSTAYSPNGLNQYTSVGSSSVGYDPNGNLTSDGSTNATYTYDTENRLVSASVGGSPTVTVSYDPLGRLFQVTNGSSTRQFLYDGDQLVAEYNGSTGAVLGRYVPGPAGDNPLIWYMGPTVSSTTRRSLQEDYQGSIQSVADASGKVLAINRYDEYGVPSTDNLGTFQYTGQAWLTEIGLYYYKARMYNPRLGRFMQTDPVGYKDDLDLYAYVGNDPLDKADPTGMTCTQGADGKYTCKVDSMKDAKGNVTKRADFSKAQQKQVAALEKSYTAAVNALADNADQKVTFSVQGDGGATVTTTAGSLASALADRQVVAAPSTQEVTTTGNVTTVGAPGLSGNHGVLGLPPFKNADAFRQLMLAHEGLHNPTTSYLQGNMSNQEFDRNHQEPFNHAAFSLLNNVD